MAKEKIAYVCTECGYDSPKWAGRCPSCGAWNTMKEQVVRPAVTEKRAAPGFVFEKARPVRLEEIATGEEPRVDMHDEELNRVLGGGLVPGSLILIVG